MSRIFVIDGRSLPDPDPSLTVDQVKGHYLQFFPELINSETSSYQREGNDYYTFVKRTGTKAGL